MAHARIVRLIETSSTRGKGIESDPVRRITELWTLDGRLVATYDPVLPSACVAMTTMEELAAQEGTP